MIILLVGLWACLEPEPRTIPPVRVVSAEEARLQEAVARGARESQPMDPETKARFEAYRARMGVLDAALEPSATMETAALLDRELYTDLGVPYLNGRWQDLVVDSIERVAQQAAAPPEVLDALRQTLLDYKEAGGASANPYVQIGLARALAMYGGPQYPECDRQAVSLCERATAWAQELASEHYIEIAARGRAEIEQAIGWKQGGVQDYGSAPREVRQALSRFETALRALLLGEQPTSEHVERATTAAAHPLLSGHLEQDPLCRLLGTFRVVLDGQRRTPREVVRAIDSRLLWLARDSGRLTTGDRWKLWGEATAALGNRASKDLERFVHATNKRPPNEVVARATTVAIAGLRRR
jgi:hypothetical protein